MNGDATISIGTAGINTNNNFPKRLQLDGSSSANTVTGVISNGTGTGVLNLIKANTSTWTLTGASTYSGTTTITGGTLAVGSSTTDGSITSTSQIINNGALAFNLGGSSTYACPISGTGAITKTRNGTLTLSGSNSFSGGTTFAGWLIAGSSNALGSGTVTLLGTAAGTQGYSLELNGWVTIGNPVVANALAGNTGGHGVVEAIGSGTATFSGTLTLLGALNAGGVFASQAGAVLLVSNATVNVPTGVAVNTRLGTTIFKNVGGNYSLVSINNTSTAALGSNDGILTSSSIDFQGAAGNYFDLAGYNQTVAGLANTYGGSSYILNNKVGTTSTLTVSSGTASSFSGLLSSGSGTLTVVKSGTAALTLTGANSYSGGTTLNGGTLFAGSNTALGSGTVTLAGGALTSGAGVTLANALYAAPATINQVYASSSGNLTLTGAVLGSGTLTTDTTLSNSVYYTGDLSGFTGTFAYNDQNNANNLSLGGTTAGSVNAASAKLIISGIASTSVNRKLNVGSTAASGTFQIGDLSGTGGVIQGNGQGTTIQVGALGLSGTFAGIINNNGTTGLTKIGAGTLTLTGSNSYTGVTTINGGALSTNLLANGGSPSGIGMAGNASSNLLIYSGTLQYTGTGASTNHTFQMGTAATIDSSGSGPVNFTNTAWVDLLGSNPHALTLTGTNTGDNRFSPQVMDYSGVTSLTKNGSGTWYITSGNANGFTGPLTINSGTLRIQQNGTQYTSGTTTINNGATLALDSGATDNIHAVVLNGGTLTAGTPEPRWGSYAFNAGINVTGSGLTSTISASGIAALNGAITVDSDAVLNVTGDFGWSAYSYNPAITKLGAGVMNLTGTNSTTGVLTVGAGTVRIGDGTTNGSIASTSIVDNGALIYNRSDSVTVSAPITGSGSLTHAGSGTLILTGTNTYGGGTTVNSGVLQVGNGTVASGIGAGPVVNNGSIVFSPGANTVTVPGAINGTGGLTLNGPGTVVLSGSNSFGGGVTLNGGGVQISSAGLGAEGGALTVAGAATIQLASNFGTSTGSRSWNLNADATVNTNGATNSLILTGTIAGSGALNKTGAGTLALDGANTFTGTINIQAGTIALDSVTTGSNLVNIGLGGKLSVTGTTVIGGDVMVAGNGGSLSNNGSIDLTGGPTGINTLRLTSTATPLYVGGASSGAYSILNVNVGAGNSASFLEIPNGTLTVGGGGLSINPNALPGATTGSATIISAAFIYNDTLITTPAIYGQTAGSFGLTTSSTDVVLNWALGSNPDTAYWNGGLGDSMGSLWFVASGNTNWVTDQAASANSLIPGANTDLHLSSTNAVNLTGQSLGANGSVKSLTFDSGESVSIVDAASTLTFSGSDTVLNINNPGQTLTLAVTTTGSGAVVIDSGTLQVGNGGGAGALPTGAISGSSGTLIYNVSATPTLPNTIGGNVHLVQAGSGVLTLSSSNNFTGGATINAGTIRLGDAHALGALSGTVAINDGGTLDLNGFSPTLANLTSGSTAMITTTSPGLASLILANSDAVTYQGSIRDGSGKIGISITGTGGVTLSGSSNYSGGTVLSPGATLSFSKSNNLGANAGNIVLNGGAIQQMGGGDTFYHTIDTGTTGGSINLIPNVTMQFNGYTSGTNAIVGSGPLTVNIPATSTFKLSSKYNTGYSGNWTFAGGGYIEVQDGGSQSIGSGTVTLETGCNMALGWSQTISNAIVSNGGALSFCNGDTGKYSGTITTNNLLTLSMCDWFSPATPRGGSVTGLISGSGGVTEIGSTLTATGTLSLVNTANNYTGPTTISYGTLIVNNIANGGQASQIGASSSDADNLAVKSWGILRYTGPSVTTDRLFGIGMPVGGTIDSSGSGPMTFTNTGTMGFAGTSGVRTVTLTGTAVGRNSLNAIISDGGGATNLIKSGSTCTWVLNGLSTYSGITTLSGGMLGVYVLADGGQPSSIGASSNASANLIVNSGTLQYTGTGASTNRQLQVGPTATIDASGSGPVKFTYGGGLAFTSTAARVLTLSGSSIDENVFAQGVSDWYGKTSLVKNGTGTWLLSAQCGLTGGIVVNAGTLALGMNTTQYSRSDITVNSGATLFLTSTNTNHVNGNLIINGGSVGSGTPNFRWGSYSFDFGINATGSGGTLSATGMVSGTSGNEIPITIDAGATLNVPGSFGWSAYNYNPAITKNGPGTMVLSGSNSTTGTLTINSGTLQIGDGASAGSVASSSIVNNSALVFSRADTSTITSAISGSGTLSKSGLGTLILTGSNTYSGGTTINSGTLQIGNGSSSGSIGIGTVANKAALVVDPGAGSIAVSNDIANTGIISMRGAGSAVFAGAISGSGSIMSNDVGALVLNGSNTYSGGTTVTNGTLKIGNANALGTGGLTVNGGTLDLNGNSVSLASFGGSGGSITSTGSSTGTLTSVVTGGTATFAGRIDGPVTVAKEGSGKLVLSGSLNIAGFNATEGAAELVTSGSIGTLNVSGSASVTVTAHSGGAPFKVIDTSAISIASGGNIDLWNNAMILRASGTAENATNLATVRSAVNAASAGLQWNGVGIGSTTAFNEAQVGKTQALALMVYDNTVITQSSFEGVSGLGFFDNGNPDGFNQVLVKLTYLGDFNADGVVNASDYTWLDGFALSANPLGDLNGDGVVNATDYTWLDGSALNQSFGVLAGRQGESNLTPAPAVASVSAGTATGLASPEAVPEPGTLSLIASGLAGLLFRRKQNRRRRA